MLIRTANQQATVKSAGGYRKWIETLVQQRWAHEIDWTEAQGVVGAEIVRSNWRVKCPFCSGAILYEPGELYFCPDCCNQANDFKAMTVAMPFADYREKIEKVLLKRPDPNTRNWFPYETLAMLRRDNLEHGHEVD